MPDTGWLELSGYGMQQIDGGTYVQAQALLAQLGTVDNPRVRILGTDEPKVVLYAGSLGLGQDNAGHDSVTVPSVNCTFTMQRSFHVFTVPTLWWATGAAYLQNLYWWLPPGTTWWVLVAWA